jgi:hypothetical protein
MGFSPHYLACLTPDERSRYDLVCRATALHLRRQGFPALEVGASFGVDDFVDMRHLSESGGCRLAAELAPQVRDLARRLGYAHGEKR